MALSAAVAALVWGDFLLCMGVYAVARRWWSRRTVMKRAGRPPRGRLLVLRPCAGDEPHLARCLESVCRAFTSMDLEVAMGVSTADDEAIPAIREALAALERRGIPSRMEVVPPTGPNRKAATLGGLTPADPRRYLAMVVADSNVDLTGFDLDLMVGQMTSDPGLGAVWAPPVEGPGSRGLGDRASEAVLAGSLHAFGLLSSLDPGGMVGKAFVIRPEALADIGGLGALTEFLGEDMEMSRRLHAAGWKVQAAAMPVQAVPAPRTLYEVIERQARWMAVIRAQRPWLLVTYPLMFASTPLLLAASLLAWPASWWLALGVASLAVASRLLVGAAARRFSGHGWTLPRGILDMVLADIVILAAFARVLTTRKVTWRGHALTLDPSGRLVHGH